MERSLAQSIGDAIDGLVERHESIAAFASFDTNGNGTLNVNLCVDRPEDAEAFLDDISDAIDSARTRLAASAAGQHPGTLRLQ